MQGVFKVMGLWCVWGTTVWGTLSVFNSTQNLSFLARNMLDIHICRFPRLCIDDILVSGYRQRSGSRGGAGADGRCFEGDGAVARSGDDCGGNPGKRHCREGFVGGREAPS
jgi:hypothetical protein